jgi:hypothetical protein
LRGLPGFCVWRALRNNAFEFVNFNRDLTNHLLEFSEEPEKSQLIRAKTPDSGIDDWTITSL